MKRSKEITEAFLQDLAKHPEELKSGRAAAPFEMQDNAALLHFYPGI